MVHQTADSGRPTDLGNTTAKVSTSGSGLPPARELLEQVAGSIENYANALQRRRDREGPASSVSEEVLERFRASAAQLRKIAQTRGSVSLAELLFEDFYGRKFDPATMVIVRDRPKNPSGDRTIKPGKTDISMVPKLDFSEAQRSAKETRLRNYLQTWARSMMKATPVQSWMDRVAKHVEELRKGGVELSAEVETDLKAWIFEEAKATGLSEDVLRQWREWLRSPAEASKDVSGAILVGTGMASLVFVNGKTAVNINGTRFYITGSQQPGMYNPKVNGNVLYIYQASNPKNLYRLDCHPLAKGGPSVLHHNITEDVKTVLNLQIADHQVAGRAARVGASAIQVFKWGGRAMFVAGALQSGIDIYYAEDRWREATGQVAGWAGAWAGAKAAGSAGAMGGGAIGGLAGPEGVPVGATIGGAMGAIGGGIGGYWSGREVATRVYDYFFLPLEKEEWLVYGEEQEGQSP